MAEEAVQAEVTPETPEAPVTPQTTPTTPPQPPEKPIALGGGKEDTTQTAPANWPVNWYEIAGGGDEKLTQRLRRFNSPLNLVKSWAAAQQKISSGELLQAKPDGKDEEALNAWRAEAGVPEKPEGYLEKLPNGLVIGEQDKELASSFINDMHQSDAPPALVHKALEWYYKNQEDRIAKVSESDKAHRMQAEDELRSEWGPEYRPNLNAIHALFNGHASEGLLEEFFSARMADGRPLGDHPGTLRFLSALAREMNPHGTVTPAPGQTPMQTIESELAQLETEMADTKMVKYDYYRNEGKQARYRELTNMKEKYAAKG